MSQREKVSTDTGLITLLSCEMQRDLSGCDQPNQQCVNSIGMSLKVTDVRINEKIPTLKV